MKRYLFILVMSLFMLIPCKQTKAGIYDNAVTYYNTYGKNENIPAMYNSDGYVYFGSRGVTSSSSVRYRTVGYTITLMNGNRTDTVEVKLGGTYIKTVSELTSGGYTYVLRRVKLTKLKSLFYGNTNITWNQIYRNNNTFRFDAIMTVVENNVQLCGNVGETNGYRSITADNNSYLYRKASDIKAARAWSKPSDLDTFYDKYVGFPATTNIDVSSISVYSDLNNVYEHDNNYYVKMGTDFCVAFNSFFDDSGSAVKIYHPNYNMYNISGWGDSQIYYTKQQTSDTNKKPYSGIISDGSSPRKPLSLNGTIESATTRFSDVSDSFVSTVSFKMCAPDSKNVFIKPEGRVYYNYTYPENLYNKDYLCDRKVAPEKSVCLVSDGKAPDISYSYQTLAIGNRADIMVSVDDVGSGVSELAVYRSDGMLCDKRTFYERTTSYYNIFSVTPDNNYKYYIYAVDNVGNCVKTSEFKFVRPIQHTIDAWLSGGIKSYNSDALHADVSGGNLPITFLVAMSEDYQNPSNERVVLANMDVRTNTFERGLYSYHYSVNPMEYIKNKADGEYTFEVISGCDYVNSIPDSVIYKKDTTEPHMVFNRVASDEYWRKTDYYMTVDVTDSYSGVESLVVINNNEYIKGKYIQEYEGGPVKGSYAINTEGENSIVIIAKDIAGNENKRTMQYNIDRTKPDIYTYGIFSLIKDNQNKWINTSQLYEDIIVRDELSGMLQTDSAYLLYERKNGSTRQILNDNIFEVSYNNENESVIRFTNDFIESLTTSQRIYMIEATDNARNTSAINLYLNVDCTKPVMDFECEEAWETSKKKGNIRLLDSHSGISSYEIKWNGEIIASDYEVNNNSCVVPIDFTDYINTDPNMTVTITDNVGNINEYILTCEVRNTIPDELRTRIR